MRLLIMKLILGGFLMVFETISSFLETLSTGSGLWNPLVWGVIAIIAFFIAYILRGFGRKDFKSEKEKAKVFLSGNPELKKEDMHLKSSNVYWGFLESLKWVYNVLEKMHTGNVSDYILWFVVIMGILFIIIGVI